MAGQRLGQHFLADESWRARIFETLQPPSGGRADDVWIEIGAGHGEMTHMLAAAGRRVFAIETDRNLAEGLRARARDWPGVKIVEGDVLALDLVGLAGGGFRIYGNLPYYITSPILHHLFRFADAIASIHILVQLEVAERIVARPGRRAYGYLSALSQFYARPEILFKVPPGAFRPRPRVTSALVEMTLPGERAKLGVRHEEAFLKFIQGCFGQKRKTLRNNLRGLLPRGRASEDIITAALTACGLGHEARAEELSLRQFAGLFQEMSLKEAPFEK